MADTRRVYYDHEPAWRQVAAKGGRGWDDLYAVRPDDSYDALDAFLSSPFAPTRAGRSAIELGCGGGQAALRVGQAGFETRAIDYSETAIELARSNAADLGARVRFDVMDALSTACLPESAFDLVVDNHCLHCITLPADRRAFLTSALRLLRPGGVFFCDTMSREGGWDAARAEADPTTGVARNGSRVWASRAELEAEVVAAGFEVMRLAVRPQCETDRWAGDMVTIYARKGC